MGRDRALIRPACEADADQVVRLVRETIATVYPRYYPREVVDFFLQLHSRESILADIREGAVIVLREGERLVGTGSRRGEHITRVYVAPDCQGNGFGGRIMDWLEQRILAEQGRICLDASLPACEFYERRGYRTAGHERIALEGGAVLVYERMEKDC